MIIITIAIAAETPAKERENGPFYAGAVRPRYLQPDPSSTVTVDEVEKALADRLKPVGTYRVRWSGERASRPQ